MRSLFKLSLLALIFATSVAQAAPMADVSNSILTVTEERVYEYTVEEFTSPVPILRERPRHIDREKAVDVARLHFSAMLTGDYGLWLSLWEEPAKKELMDKHYREGKGAEFWMDLWARTFDKFDTFSLTRTVKTGEYVIIEMKAVDDHSGEVLFVDVPLKPVRVTPDATPSWYPTKDLDGDAVFTHWRKPNFTARKVARKMWEQSL